ncbi:hypothetical protein [Simiduia aestuariiviva]|uniref:Lipoprotein n=1 Tax=Simiduia aestuariiviva TaxID=1510459 RepID=A0A839UKP9_9GAMM|nr:hypothetical protein [Simiduia aestuariiviva]MBB3167180.1 hypothetical protein [Simiduia aestuariiviva]
MKNFKSKSYLLKVSLIFVFILGCAKKSNEFDLQGVQVNVSDTITVRLEKPEKTRGVFRSRLKSVGVNGGAFDVSVTTFTEIVMLEDVSKRLEGDRFECPVGKKVSSGFSHKMGFDSVVNTCLDEGGDLTYEIYQRVVENKYILVVLTFESKNQRIKDQVYNWVDVDVNLPLTP